MKPTRGADSERRKRSGGSHSYPTRSAKATLGTHSLHSAFPHPDFSAWFTQEGPLPIHSDWYPTVCPQGDTNALCVNGGVHGQPESHSEATLTPTRRILQRPTLLVNQWKKWKQREGQEKKKNEGEEKKEEEERSRRGKTEGMNGKETHRPIIYACTKEWKGGVGKREAAVCSRHPVTISNN
ncbi:hypothetical protein RJT34_16477 [Clitoria ternatea]|uniref:Uncharacterized protein n=1 Tax=Clitoria ternatea TaxID=43366 RepID=A0AAN9J777_CLITE